LDRETPLPSDAFERAIWNRPLLFNVVIIIFFIVVGRGTLPWRPGDAFQSQ
jgi:hypothetical protein